MVGESSNRERRADGAIHRIGIAAALLGAAVLLAQTTETARALVAAAVYGAGLVAMIGCSAAYNIATAPARIALLRRCDRAAIYAMIAGSYTPFALVGMGPAGLWLLVPVWAIALSGMALAWFRPGRFERFALGLYLAMGWCGLPALLARAVALPAPSLWLLGAGGAFYTVGVGFHLARRLPYHNAIWHGFVLAGAACHYVAVFDTLAG